MNPIAAATIWLAVVSASPALAQKMEIKPSSTRLAGQAPEQYFSGSVTLAPLYPANEHTHSSGGLVTFEPGARSAWHTHPAGQVLIITTGIGRVQEEGGKKLEVKAGDVIWTPPGVKHWHGATASSGMAHIAVTNMLGGKNVDWMEKVSDEQYRD
jgi:quercetin dioxygenase-like cupin family protein